MNRIALLLLASLAVGAYANCNTAILKAGACAMLFEKEDCEGDSQVVEYGAGNIKNSEDHKSVLVRKNCSFRGYDEEADTRKGLNLFRRDNLEVIKILGEKEIVNAPATKNKFHNFDDLEEDIEFVSCTRGNQGNCPAVPEFLCAICYDENNCGEGDWSPLDIPITEEYKLPGGSLFSSGPKNGIESCSVRRGCTLTLMDTDSTPGKDRGNLTVSAIGKKDDVHFNLTDNPNKAYSKIADDAEVVVCSCGAEEHPKFSYGV